MAASEVLGRVAIDKGLLGRTEELTEDAPGVGAGDTVHPVEEEAEILPLE